MAARGKTRTSRTRRRSRREEITARVRLDSPPDGVHQKSPTAVAAEMLRTGLAGPRTRRLEEIPHEDAAMRVGDPDDSSLQNEYVGENVPGASTPTPDQNGVDAIGIAYGLQEEDEGTLRSSAEILARRDRHRTELRPPKRPLA